MEVNTHNIPTVLIILGATGDLMEKKIIPALFHLFEEGQLPNLFKVIGISRRDFTQEEFRTYLDQSLLHHSKPQKSKLNSFLNLFTYQQGRFEKKADYKKLTSLLENIDHAWRVCSNKLFYLAVPPKFYETIFKNLANSKLAMPCSPEEGWTRVLVEKPFGYDKKTAVMLDTLLWKLFKEEQIYRIDHYLAKEMLQNILAFRFANNLFEQNWNNQLIERIEIKVLESIGVETRGNFYDGVGALRDVGQNHLLQMLALITMDHPPDFSAQHIRTKRAEILKRVKAPRDEEIKKYTFRAQYQGYQDIAGVRENSSTETYFKLQLSFDTYPWRGIPIILESGKRFHRPRKEIIVTLKHQTPCLCPPTQHYQNQILFTLEPEERITLKFLTKKPGLVMEVEEHAFDFPLHIHPQKQYIQEYEKLLMDCIRGDQTLFVSSEEVRQAWRIIDPIVEAWDKNEVYLESYLPNTDEVLLKSRFASLSLKKEIGIIGLGKMGENIALHLLEKGWNIIGYRRNPTHNAIPHAASFQELSKKLSPPRIIWLMVPAEAVDEVIFGKLGLCQWIQKGDIIIDGGNSYFKDTIRRAKILQKSGIKFIDIGVSGGPSGARLGASLMVGGEKKTFEYIEPLVKDLALQETSYQFFPGVGAGHFVKMIHNGIEYGMMQAIGEGFTILKNSKYKLDLEKVAEVYNKGTVIESRLINWLRRSFEIHGPDLKGVVGSVAHTGEGSWTAQTAKEMHIKARVIEESLKFRIHSEKHPNYMGKILSALREQFGGHSVGKGENKGKINKQRKK